MLTCTNREYEEQENKESIESTGGMLTKNPPMVKLVAKESPRTQGY